MKYGCYCYIDLKSGKFDIPWFSPNDIAAKRKFHLDATANEGHSVLGKFTKDFNLLKLAYYDCDSSIFERAGNEEIGICECILTGEELARTLNHLKGDIE